jgi:hypothetical protein
VTQVQLNYSVKQRAMLGWYRVQSHVENLGVLGALAVRTKRGNGNEPDNG